MAGHYKKDSIKLLRKEENKDRRQGRKACKSTEKSHRLTNNSSRGKALSRHRLSQIPITVRPALKTYGYDQVHLAMINHAQYLKLGSWNRLLFVIVAEFASEAHRVNKNNKLQLVRADCPSSKAPPEYSIGKAMNPCKLYRVEDINKRHPSSLRNAFQWTVPRALKHSHSCT